MRTYWGALGVCVQRKPGFLEKALGVEIHPLGFCAGRGGAVGRWSSGDVSLLIGHPARTEMQPEAEGADVALGGRGPKPARRAVGGEREGLGPVLASPGFGVGGGRSGGIGDTQSHARWGSEPSTSNQQWSLGSWPGCLRPQAGHSASLGLTSVFCK